MGLGRENSCCVVGVEVIGSSRARGLIRCLDVNRNHKSCGRQWIYASMAGADQSQGAVLMLPRGLPRYKPNC